MVFGWGRSSALAASEQRPVAADDATRADSRPSAGLASMAADAGDVSWAPLPSGGFDAARKPKQPSPFKVKTHDIKAHLQDRSTAVVDLLSVVDAPGDVMFDLLADPHQHEHIFDAIESASAELVSEEGSVRKWRLDYRAKWKFWKVGGVCDNRLWMTTDRERGTVSFVLREPGFLRKYEGTWTITGPDGKGPGGSGTSSDASAVTAAAAAAASASAGASRRRFSTDSSSPPSPSAASNDSTALGPDSHALSLSSRSSSRSSLCSDNGSLDRSSVGDPSVFEAPHSPAFRGNGGSGNGTGGLAGFLAAINNPFFTTTPPPSLLALFRASEKTAAVAEAIAPAAGAAAAPPPPPARRFPTTIQIRKAISPKVSPPYPLNQVLKGHATGQVNDMLEGLLAATARKIGEEQWGGCGQQGWGQQGWSQQQQQQGAAGHQQSSSRAGEQSRRAPLSRRSTTDLRI